MKKLLTIALLLAFALALQAQKQVTIQGKVTNLNSPLVNAEVTSERTGETVKTNKEGKYLLQTSAGDLVTFTYPGLSDVEIIVEDVTSFLNVDLNPEVIQLDEVVLKKMRRPTEEQLRGTYRTNKNLIFTAFGMRDKESTSFSMKIIEGKDLPLGNIDFAYALQGRVAGMRVERNAGIPCPNIYLRGAAGVGFLPAIYDVDGLIFTEPPCFIMVENIERIAVMRGLGLVNRYGFQANGGVIVINTKGGSSFLGVENGKPYDQALLRNNIYEGNALSKDQISKNVPTYLKELYASSSEREAREIYERQKGMYSGSMYYFLDAFGYFSAKWRNTDFADQIIEEHWYMFKENPVGLKALAYLYEVLGEEEKAHELYKEVFILRPNYAQSYRDLALSYSDVRDRRKAAAMYARYDYLITEGFIRAEDLNFTPLMEREFSNLLELHASELIGTDRRKGKSLNSDFEGTRLVFEWNDSEAEFQLQFVNPQNKYFNWEHSLLADGDRIRDEKLKGYSCEEYLIDGSLPGTWQVNLKYLGNKSLTPTYLKATIYYNYGTPSQRKEVKVFKLQLKDVYQELFSVNSSQAVAAD
ncbi:hypothetical protein SAMN06265375_104124 [Muriicola jejuensis]|uniref:Uncharacterized protein n=1 Tax=Muriicola jejuensis TaxID=504488 RepID=A0A6P0UDM2_9FLAO|nr:hypothetical protein [Muriicola jejuensis]NER11137.1 hypothetical protein [Muriicola jejuensis]SMP24014.1 hypothetical protein SAMN06265375_104124 [Muriicola jejuensis]